MNDTATVADGDDGGSLATGAGSGSDGGSAVAAWLVDETPGIIEGLEESGSIGASTASAARHLVAEGSPESALRLVLGDALG
jgi:hypothetical protein